MNTKTSPADPAVLRGQAENGCWLSPGWARAAADRIDVLTAALAQARIAVAALDEDALGRDRQHGYPYRDELLSEIDAALSKSDAA